MARRHTDTCVGCTSMGLPCRGNRCSNYHFAVEYTCDKCGKEFNPEELFDVDGDMLCGDCLLESFKTIAEIDEEN